MQKKTQQPVQFEITEETCDAVASWVATAHLRSEQYLCGIDSWQAFTAAANSVDRQHSSYRLRLPRFLTDKSRAFTDFSSDDFPWVSLLIPARK